MKFISGYYRNITKYLLLKGVLGLARLSNNALKRSSHLILTTILSGKHRGINDFPKRVKGRAKI